MTLKRGSCFSFPYPLPSVLQCPSWIFAAYFIALSIFAYLHYYVLSYIFAPVVLKFESWYLPTESGAVRVRPLSWPGCPYQDSAQVVICIQSMQTFSLTLSPRLLHDSPHKVEQNDGSSTLFLSQSVRFRRPPHDEGDDISRNVPEAWSFDPQGCCQESSFIMRKHLCGITGDPQNLRLTPPS
ncbi:hypothetical protein CY34DRAFT_799430 [Suillus luteus UH-Slu-Lm8-n1]|uniref:Uncharacterized protein n=1 Tax=Suillus luteus UH-Slu-Lm8-n1 TaxID=930992 RepID=A0A0D0BCH0_9AGAM|nr:hypothetical protein CY34DRAFT_799430 [Suillus luteus UH-Slu-Lm8-n1]